MKAFSYSLERMRRYKEQMLGKEKDLLQEMLAQKYEYEQQTLQLRRHRESKAAELVQKQRTGMHASELQSYRFVSENIRCQLEALAKQLQLLEVRIERQRKVVVAAMHELSGLDKLEEKQREEYDQEAAKERQAELLDYISTGLVAGEAVSEASPTT